MKSLIILTIATFILTQVTFADCLACWKLQYVKITMTDDQVIQGYLRWNESWAPESDQKNSFYKKYLSAAEKWNWEKLIVYNDVFELKQTLNISGLVTSKESLAAIDIKNIKGIELIENEKNKLTGAGDITDLNQESLKLLNEEPNFLYKDEGEVAVTYFLSYNKNINKDNLIEISETSGYWLKRRYYEKEKVIIIIEAWD